MKTPTAQHDHGEPEQPVGAGDIVISVQNLTKKYRIFSHPGDRIKQALTFGRVRFHREFTALQDVSFEIKKGEAVGIIGRNGSGKSTLLQLICGILKPTSGTVQTNGRISALLELGAGFNPEFTGRENVYFQGAVMGLTKAEMDARFDDIAAFADIGDFIDQPVRIYSSGMYLRLTFATAVSVDPDVLVVDEALAVGDASFRSRCFLRIGELRSSGCTILFVSHDMAQIASLCGQAMLMDKGELLAFGKPQPLVSWYQRFVGAELDAREKMRKAYKDEKNLTANEDMLVDDEDKAKTTECYDKKLPPVNAVSYEQNGALIESIQILTLAGERVNQLFSGNTYRCTYRVHFIKNSSNVRFAMLIKTSTSMDLGGAMSAPTPSDGIPNVAQGMTAKADFEFDCMLNPGMYHISVAVFGCMAGMEYALHGITCAEAFRVIADTKSLAIASVDFNCRPVVHIFEQEERR